MPASARLLQKVQETWGEDVTQDLVTWVGEAQPVNRAEIRELADVYFARFGERLDERVAMAETRLEAKLDGRIAAAETRLEAKLDGRIAAAETRLEAKLDGRIAGAETKLDERIAAAEARLEAQLDGRIGGVRLEVARLEGRLDAGLATLRADVAFQMRDQMKWMFVFWIGTLVPLAGLIVALGKGWL